MLQNNFDIYAMSLQPPKTPHDATFKGFLNQVDNARDFFDIYLPENIKSLCDFKTLALTNSSFIDNKLRSRLSDVLYSVKTDMGDGYFYLLVEHQSTPDKLMSWRLMYYAFSAMNQHLQQGHKVLPLVVPILFYHGKMSPYPYQNLWTHCFDWKELAEELYFKPFPLVDITVIDDNELANHRKIAVMELAMKHKNLRDEYQRMVELFAQTLNNNGNSQDDITIILQYLLVVLESPEHFEQIIHCFSQQIPQHKEVVMNLAERLRQEGQEKGHKIGIEEGIEKGRKIGVEEGVKITQRQMVKSLFTAGANIELIMAGTKLSREEILSLIEEQTQ